MSYNSCYTEFSNKYGVSPPSPLSCFSINLRNILLDIHIFEIGIFLSLVIILVSIFSKIKDDYRWFLLNQSLFELSYLLIYSTCKYRITELLDLNQSAVVCWRYASFIKEHPQVYRILSYAFYEERSCAIFPLFLLTLTRFLSVYATSRYDQWFTKKKIFPIIVVYDVLVRIYSFVIGIINGNSFIERIEPGSFKNFAFFKQFLSSIIKNAHFLKFFRHP